MRLCYLQGRAEFAAAEAAEGGEAVVEFGGGEDAGAVEVAEEVVGVGIGFAAVALLAGGDEIAVGVATLGAGDDVLDDEVGGIYGAEAIEAAIGFTAQQGLAIFGHGEEVGVFDGRGVRGRGRRDAPGDLIGQVDADDGALAGDFEHFYAAFVDERMDALAGGSFRHGLAGFAGAEGHA